MVFTDAGLPVSRRPQAGSIAGNIADSIAGDGHGASAAPTFILVHGIGMGRITFEGVAERLGERARVIGLDLPGFGDSPEPGTAASLEATAEAVTRLIEDEVGGGTNDGVVAAGGVILVGHSMGTQIVTEIAYHHPDLVRALVLIAPTVNRHERTALRQAARMVQDLSGEGPKVLLTGLYEYFKTSPAWYLNKLRFMLGHKIERLCREVQAPTLVLRGETDRVCPRDWVSEIARAFPRATMREIAGRGHEAIIKSPEPVATMILDFAASEGLLPAE